MLSDQFQQSSRTLVRHAGDSFAHLRANRRPRHGRMNSTHFEADGLRGLYGGDEATIAAARRALGAGTRAVAPPVQSFAAGRRR